MNCCYSIYRLVILSPKVAYSCVACRIYLGIDCNLFVNVRIMQFISAIKATFTFQGCSFLHCSNCIPFLFQIKILPLQLNIFLIMNSSQLLYKISNLKYTIRMKECEYIDALNANDKLKIDLHEASLILLKEDLHKTVEEFNSIQTDNPREKTASPKNPRKWPNLFNFRTAFFNRK
jgi:hypothetical protein